jgi:DNA-binding NarL/FixJ family response regulator
MSGVGVLIVHPDDHARRSARSVVSSTPAFEPLGEAATAEEALEQAMALQPRLALVAEAMPGIDGLETSRRLTHALPTTTVVVLYGSAEPDPRVAADAGAAATLPADALTPAALQALWEEHGRG